VSGARSHCSADWHTRPVVRDGVIWVFGPARQRNDQSELAVRHTAWIFACFPAEVLLVKQIVGARHDQRAGSVSRRALRQVPG